MHAREALNEVIKVHNLKAADISRSSGIDVHQISKFRNGKKDFTTETFFKLINGLPKSAKSHLLALCMFEDEIVGVNDSSAEYKV